MASENNAVGEATPHAESGNNMEFQIRLAARPHDQARRALYAENPTTGGMPPEYTRAPRKTNPRLAQDGPAQDGPARDGPARDGPAQDGAPQLKFVKFVNETTRAMVASKGPF